MKAQLIFTIGNILSGVLTRKKIGRFLFLCVLHSVAIANAANSKAANSDPDWKKLAPHLNQASQLIWVEPAPLFQSKIKLYEKQDNVWKSVRLENMPAEFPAVIGMLGYADPARKTEGDKKTPTGIYSFGDRFFGKDNASFAHWKYKQVTDADKWIDDQTHPDYNKWIVGETTAKSYETLLRGDDQYDQAAVIGYNMNPIVPGKGSAIFMHVWRNELLGTAGCVAMKKEYLEKVLHWMDQSKNPQILLSDVK
jgi:L,D-peptidoglycan transpeptidase YkuD (ErfK/YbiS/YcfS/YnhG family)